MRKFILRYFKDWKINLIYLLVSLGVSALVFCLYFFLMDRTLYDACNGLAITFGVLFAFFGFALLNRLGAFDTLGYGVHCMTTSMFTKREKKYVDLVNYRNVKRAERKTKPLTYVSIGIVWFLVLIALICVEIIFNLSFK